MYRGCFEGKQLVLCVFSVCTKCLMFSHVEKLDHIDRNNHSMSSALLS